MPLDLVMPRLSDTMSEGTVARWLKKTGDSVKKGEPLAEIETDKATMPLESFTDGVLGQIIVGDGETIALGERIAIMYSLEEAKAGLPAATEAQKVAAPAPASTSAPSTGAAGAAPATESAVVAQPQANPASASEGNGRLRASPLARRTATNTNVDLSLVTGTGPGGRIVRADVEEFAKQPSTTPAAEPTNTSSASAADDPPPRSGEFVPFSRIQSVVARRMVESKSQVPHFYATIAIDMGPAMRLRGESNAFLGKEKAFSINDLFVRSVALTLRKFPVVNASFHDSGIQYNADINIGFAVSLPGSLVVPVIRNADQKPLPQIGAESRVLTQKARSGGLQLSDYEGGTFTISNLGMRGIESFSAIINPPQAAILAIGAVGQEPVVVDDQLAVGQRCRVTISCDHRVAYGADAAEFLSELKSLLERPFSLVY